MQGTFTNYTFNQTIPISGSVNGLFGDNSIMLIDKNEYINGYDKGKVIKISTLTGTFINTESILLINEHVLDIKSINTLGRKELSKPNPILGEDLNKTTKNVDVYEQYGQEQWQLIEYITNYNREIPIPQELPEYSTRQSESSINTRTLLATPKFLRSTRSLAFITEETEEINEPNEIDTENEITYLYCAYIDHTYNQILIKKVTSTDIIDMIGLIAGPIDDLTELQNQIISYININNYNIFKISDFEYNIEPIPFERRTF